MKNVSEKSSTPTDDYTLGKQLSETSDPNTFLPKVYWFLPCVVS